MGWFRVRPGGLAYLQTIEKKKPGRRGISGKGMMNLLVGMENRAVIHAAGFSIMTTPKRYKACIVVRARTPAGKD